MDTHAEWNLYKFQHLKILPIWIPREQFHVSFQTFNDTSSPQAMELFQRQQQKGRKLDVTTLRYLDEPSSRMERCDPSNFIGNLLGSL